jgi:chromosome segregation protein
VDAALDESNIDRLIGIVREFMSNSQFIIITHSKRTLGVADVLYGITMEEQGVSKKVAVKLNQALRMAA